MSDFGDTTGMQNPIFKIMGSQATQNQQGQQGQSGMVQNPMNLNPNSMAQNQMGMQGIKEWEVKCQEWDK